MNQTALSVDDIEVRFGSTQILRGISLAVERGESVGLLGHNGAGKTTTLRAIMGLVPLNGGNIEVADTALGRMAAERRVRLGIGYSPEDRRMIGGMSVEDNLFLPTYACRMKMADRVDQLDRVFHLIPELKSLRKRAAGALSGGQQKMVALGRALMIGRTLLLLDEPFQGLAPVLARGYAETLAGLRERDANIAILISETNRTLLENLVQRMYTINRGEIESESRGTA
jgi:branched-chain amino acid transport system ATP-binding protein